jgi:hypothetical protein
VHGRTGLYPADALAKQGIIVVSMNDRMARLGFVAHPALTAEAPDDLRGSFRLSGISARCSADDMTGAIDTVSP